MNTSSAITTWVHALVALLGFGAVAWKTAPRDQFIGRSAQQRHHARHLIVNNARFLILPWVRSKGLASKILGHIARRLPTDWQQRYGYRPVLLETFVQSDRFRGTCYKAANWVHVGQTTGRGKLDITHQHAPPVKDIWLYPLVRTFRQQLTAGSGLTRSRSRNPEPKSPFWARRVGRSLYAPMPRLRKSG